MRLREPLVVRCNSCNNSFSVELDFDCITTDERDMGTEYDFEGVFDGTCPHCGKDIYIQVEAYEYPEGVVNDYNEQVVDGATIEGKIYLKAD